LRSDQGKIHIEQGSNAQDLSVLYAGPGQMLKIGQRSSIGHRAVLFGCTVGDYSPIGIGAVLLDGVKVGRNCIITSGKLSATTHHTLPDTDLIPCRTRRALTVSHSGTATCCTTRYTPIIGHSNTGLIDFHNNSFGGFVALYRVRSLNGYRK
jgi:carbonic anhydrase/acetyltransferase-like protein (isoleucine patch superfamily)